MSQNYVIIQNNSIPENGPKDRIEIIIGTWDHEILSRLAAILGGFQVVSAGTVAFKYAIGASVQADVTHGSLLLNIPIDLERLKIDQKLIEKKFL